MSWTYTGDPSAVARDAVRFLSGQTSSADEVIVLDEEVAYAISETANSYYAAALIAETLAARYRGAGPQSETIGRLSVTWGDRAKTFEALAGTLRRRAAVKSLTPFLGGQSIADQQGREADTDLRQPAFTTNQFDYDTSSTSSVSTG